MEMDWGELRVRTYQEFAKRWDLALCQIGGPFFRDGRAPQLQGFGRFFFSEEEARDILKCLHELLPEMAKGIVNQPEQTCDPPLDLSSYQGVEYVRESDRH